MPYSISWMEETPVWTGVDSETGESIFGTETRRAGYPHVPDERYDELLADAQKRTCDPDSIEVEEIPDPESAPEEATVWDELDAAYQEGVNGAYDQ